MLDRTYSFSADTIAFNRDAVDGFAAISAALDQGLVARSRSNGASIVDAVAIGLGWMVLVALILHPALQLAAIGACACLIATRSLLRRAFGRQEPSCPRSLFSESSSSVLTGQLA